MAIYNFRVLLKYLLTSSDWDDKKVKKFETFCQRKGVVKMDNSTEILYQEPSQLIEEFQSKNGSKK